MPSDSNIERVLKKAGELSSAERKLLDDEAGALMDRNKSGVARLRALRTGESLTPEQRDEIQEIRNRIGPDLKRAANMHRKTGRPVESVR